MSKGFSCPFFSDDQHESAVATARGQAVALGHCIQNRRTPPMGYIVTGSLMLEVNSFVNKQLCRSLVGCIRSPKKLERLGPLELHLVVEELMRRSGIFNIVYLSFTKKKLDYMVFGVRC